MLRMGNHLTEEDVKNRFITPAIDHAGWEKEQYRMEYQFTDGPIIVRGSITDRGKSKKADYLLMSKDSNLPLAIVEAKDGKHVLGAGMQQAIDYANSLQVPFAYSSNGTGFLEHDFFTGKERQLKLKEFPKPEELWHRYQVGKGLTPKELKLVSEPNYYDPFTKKRPRYYQQVAINRTMEAVAKGRKRLLLVMATGTGKTFTAFQIVWKLINAGKVKRVLYLADRNILIDQTMQQDFKPFEKVINKIHNKNLDSSYEVYMSLYQQLAGDDKNEPFRKFKPEFFDLIIVDECHRGSVKDDSLWRKILSYFNSAVQIGMTATPRDDKAGSNIDYFGEPIYVYSLKSGIDDGFLAPYKVIRITIDRDVEGWRPYEGQRDLNGEIIEDREYYGSDFDKKIIIDERTKAVAKCITKWLKTNDRFSKSIIFCVDIAHAERMRQALVNENSDLVQQNPKYIMRITGDNPEGKAQLDYFIDVHEKYPTIVTTSKLLTTGVDVKTCKLIVLDSVINSMTEFKQVIGRGTRLYPDEGKIYFTIMDFRNVSKLFADPGFDGEPVAVTDVVWKPGEDPEPPELVPPEPIPPEPVPPEPVPPEPLPPDPVPPGPVPPPDPPKPTIIHVNGVTVTILQERVQYIGPDGKLITESLTDYTKKNIKGEFASLDVFLQAWHDADKKEAIVDALKERGVLLDALREASGDKDLDDFDLILHIAYDQKPLTKKERINNVKKRDYLHKYGPDCQKVLSALMDKYMNEGISEVEDTRVLDNEPFNQYGSASQIAMLFGGRQQYVNAVHEMVNQIYM
jgi:type I restriction enzyme R subunit